MTEPLDLDAIRARHVPTSDGSACVVCNPERDPEWPCLVVRLCDEVERLRLWEVNIFPDRTVADRMAQSEAPTVSDGGCAECQHSPGEHDSYNRCLTCGCQHYVSRLSR